jgi:membrane fusion protein, multidrug efflux system
LNMEGNAATAPAPVGFLQTRRGRWLLTAAVIFAVIGLLWLGYWYLYARRYEDTDDAYVAGDLVNVMSQVSGTVVSIGADDTDLVQAGQELIRLDSTDAQIALRDSEARLARTVRQTRTVFANRDQLEAVVAQRRADLSRAQSDLDRRKDLTKTGAVSAEELSHARDALSAARDGWVAAQKNLAASAALAGRTGVADNPDVQAAATDVEHAYLALRRTSIHAPVSGYVAKRAVQLGERVAPGGQPLLTIVPLERLRIEANFKEVQLSEMRIGQPARIVADLYGGHVEFHGTVAGLGLGTGAAFALLPAQNATGNWIKVVQRVPVRIALDQKELTEHPLRIGLSTKVQVDVHDVSGAILARTPRQTPVLATSAYDIDRQEIQARIAHIVEENVAEGSERLAAPSR